MTSPSVPAVSFVEVDRALAGRRRGLAFSPTLEARMEADTERVRRRHFAVTMLVGLVLYCMSLAGDYEMLPAAFADILLIKLGIVAPVLVAILVFITAAQPAAWLRESVVAATGLLAAGGFLYAASASDDPLTAHIHYGAVLSIVFVNVILRVRFWYACLGSGLVLACYALVVSQLGGMASSAAANAIMLMSVTAAATLYANFSLERSERTSYLTSLRSQIRNRHLTLANEELSRISNLDPMTGLSNRRGFDAQAAAIWPAAIENGQSVALLMIDVDYFKRFNDHHGHQAGDGCLRQVAETARAQLREDDELMARYGGEEFVALLPRADLVDGIRAAERIRRAIEALGVDNPAVPLGIVTASIGIAAAPATTGGSFHELIEAADAALYEAKARGRNRVWPPILSADPELMVQTGNGEAAAADLTNVA